VTLRRRTHRAAALAVGAIAAIGLSACGHKIADPTTADSEQIYVRAGQLTYQVQLSRQLNQYATEDREYFAGVTATPPTPDQQWFAVFMWAKNEQKQAETTVGPGAFDLVDTQGNKYYPVATNASVNPFAWTSQTLPPLGTAPAPDSVASFGPTQGLVLLFKISTSAYSNRPLTLEIHAADQAEPSTVSLDL
jgi:hypothetical protein